MSETGGLYGAILHFPFESMNGKLLKLFQGTQNIHGQICEKFLMNYIPIIADELEAFKNCPHLLKLFCGLVKDYPLLLSDVISKTKFIRKPQHVFLKSKEILALHTEFHGSYICYAMKKINFKGMVL